MHYPAGDVRGQNLQTSDQRLAIIATLIFLLAGMAGGKDHWNTPNGFLPNICLLYLPCLAVWFGRRLESAVSAIGIPAGLGLLLIIPSLLIFTKGNSDGRVVAIMMTVGLPAIIAAGARALKTIRPPPRAEDGVDSLRSAAKRNRIFGIIGVLFFPQLVQPAILDVALDLKSAGSKHDNDGQILGAAEFAKWVALIVLGIIALAGMGSLLMALMDAFFPW